jgi:hypothetical protein
MFYAALALLQKIGKVPSKHTGVISLFDTEFVVKGIFHKELSRNFHKAFEMRQMLPPKVRSESRSDIRRLGYEDYTDLVAVGKDTAKGRHGRTAF